MAETKPITTKDDKATSGERTIRTYEEALNAPVPAPTPSQAEADAILLGEEIEPPPEGETPAARAKREEDARKKREAKAASDQAAGYQTRNA